MRARALIQAAGVVVLMLAWSAGPAPARAVPLEPPEVPNIPSRVGPSRHLPFGRLPREAVAELRGAMALRAQQSRAQPSGSPPALGTPGFSLRYEQTFGETGVPYFDDTAHLNAPVGVWAGGSSVWIAEYSGSRVLRYGNDGLFQMQIGQTGMPYALGDTELHYPKDVGVDGGGDIWVVDEACHVAHFDSSGAFVGELGAIWWCDDANDHLAWPSSIAFDGDGNIYVSDTGNERVQIFDSAGGYLATIGVTGESGADNNHFNSPIGIAIDSADKLYVADPGNARVQIIDVANPLSPAYVATLGVSGVTGSDNVHFYEPQGVAVDATRIYVVDSANSRVQIFDRATRAYLATLGTGWGNGAYEFFWPTDVGLDGAGRIYVADSWSHRVQEYSSGLVYQRTYGVTGVPYLTDSQHFNWPSGVAVAGDGSLYITEERGHRLAKLTAQGVPLWSVGEPGVPGSDDVSLFWPGDVDVSPVGQAHVADSGNNRIQIFSSGGSYVATLGTGDWGTGNYDFSYPMGVAVDGGGSIYVADSDNHRVQIYNASRIYVATLGVTGVPGSDNGHFDWPDDVDVDSAGNIYVADSGNSRVQVFNASRAYVRTLGETDVTGEDFGHFGYPYAVAVDAQGRTYVSEDWPQRVQVHDGTGAYLTTVAGSWGARTGDLRNPEGVAVDAAGNLFIADTLNQRVQKLAPGVPDWRQSNINGFGSPAEIIFALAPLGSTLYAGTSTASGDGAQIWRRSGGIWSSVMTNGFGDPLNQVIDHLIEFNGALYAGTGNWDDAIQISEGGEVWRSDTGTSWTQVVDGGFGNADNTEAYRFALYDGDLYVGTWNGWGTAGGEIWRSPSGDAGSWTQSVANGFGSASNAAILSFQPHAGQLYAGTMNSDNGAEIWRSATGASGSWSSVTTGGFGDVDNAAIAALAEFESDLYAATWHAVGAGGEVWRCHICDGSDWAQVIDDGMSNERNRSMSALEVAGARLYWVVGQPWAVGTGLEVWWTSTGDEGAWRQIGYAGFGDSNNRAPYWDNSVVAFNDNLVVGTINTAHGGEIWVLLNDLFLPLVMRNYP